jgi:adenylate cyclase
MTQRRLTAIMFSDIAGYTAMMQENEQQGKKVAQTYRKLLNERAAAHDGRIVQHFGDGSLTIFKSSVEALQCASEIQESIKAYDIPLRIGIHLGDINIDGEDIFGDGVNIASRVESLGVPGSILFTKRIYEDILSHPQFTVKTMGQFHFKNDKVPRELYALEVPGYITPTRETLTNTHQAKLKSTVNIQSVLILPFENYTGNENLDYVAAGMHSSLISDIGRIGALRVISPTSARAYRKMEKPLPVIANEAKVEVIIEPNITSYGDAICIQLRGMSMYPEEKQLFVEEYEVEKNQVLNLFNNACKDMAEKMMVELTPEEKRMLAKSRTVNEEAYDLYLRGQKLLDKVEPQPLEKAAECFRKAIELDADWAHAYTGLAEVALYQNQAGFVPTSTAIPMIYNNLNKALSIDPDSANSHYIKAVNSVWTEWDWETGEAEFKKALELNPSHAQCHMFYAHLLLILNRKDEAYNYAKVGYELEPLRPIILGLYSILYIDDNNNDKALKLINQSLEIDPEHFFSFVQKEIAHFNIGDYESSLEMLKTIWSIYLGDDRDAVLSGIDDVFKQEGYFGALEYILPMLEEQGKAGKMVPTDLVYYFLRTKNIDKALVWLEKGHAIHDPNMPYITTNYAAFHLLNDEPRYIELLKKMNLRLHQ